MIFVATDILNPYKREIISQNSYPTLIDFLIENYPLGFKRPTDISVNGHEVKIDDYDIELREDDVVVLLDRAALPVSLIGSWFITALANLAISVTLSYVANKLFAPDAPEDQGTPSPVYNLNSAQNTARYGAPIPIVYGKVRMFPSMIVQPYYKFENDIEYLYHILCVGQGALTTDKIFIGEDEVTNAGDVQWKLLNKSDFYNIPLRAYGVHITKTLSNPSNIELTGAGDGYQGPETEKYRISASASKVEFDYMMPNGLFWNNNGSLESALSVFEFRIYTLSGSTYTQVFGDVIIISEKSIDAIQRTYTKDISSYTQDVYVTFKRTVESSDIRVTQDLYVKRIKEIYPNEDFTTRYGDITLLAAKIKATNAISTQGQVKVNGYFTRTDVGNTMSEVLTDIYTNTTYGGGLNASDLNFPTTTETVNCAYDTSSTIFDAMRRPALAQGYSLYLAGMDVILKKDGANNITTGMYNEMNILRNSFKAQYLFKEEYPANDGFKCTYIDGNGWIQKSVTYPSTSSRPQVVDLFGVVDYSYLWPKGTNLLIKDSITSIGTLGGINDIDISGNYAFAVSIDNDNIISINISDPTNISVSNIYSSATHINGAAGIAISGNYAYVSSIYSNSLAVIDISNPAALSYLGKYTSAFSELYYDVAVDGNVAYVIGNNTNSILSLDISTTTPTLLHRFVSASLGSPYGIGINNGVAYVVGTTGSITAIDISTPSSMSEISTYSPAIIATGRNVKIKDNVAYVTSNGNDSFISIDISDPSNMVVLDSITNITQLNDAWDISIINDLAIVTSLVGDSATSIDISDPSNMVIVDFLTDALLNGAKGVAISGYNAYICGSIDGTIVSVDIT